MSQQARGREAWEQSPPNRPNDEASTPTLPTTTTTTTTHNPHPLSLEDVVDDFSLPSHGIRFRVRGKEMKIYEHRTGQLILEERGSTTATSAPPGPPPPHDNGQDSGGGEREQDGGDDDEDEDDDHGVDNKQDAGGGNGILMKTVNDGEYAFSFLRAAYCLMATFVGGFLFILGLCLLLFLFINIFIDLATAMGMETTSSSFDPVKVFATLLSIPVFIYGYTLKMTLVGRFVVDTFYGHPLFGSFGLGVATTDWIAFVLYLGVPIVSFIVTLFLRMDNWWEISLLAWFASILTFWCLFSACVMWLDVWACIALMEDYDYGNNSLIPDDDPWRAARVRYWLGRVGEVTVRTMRYRWSGTRADFRSVDEGSIATTTTVNGRCNDCISGCKEGPCSFFARWPRNPCFVRKPPERIHTLDETLGNITFVTRYSWSLEKLFCRKVGLSSSIPITQGESSITEAQINSNIACNILGNIMIVLLFVGAMVWFGLPFAALGIVTILAVIFLVRVGFATYWLFGVRDDIVNHENAVLYRYWEIYQDSSPTDGFIRAVLFFQVVFLYLVPLIFLCITNPPPAPLFAFLGFFSGVHYYLNIRILILENKDYFHNTPGVDSKMGRKKWKRKATMYDLVRVGGDKAMRFWKFTYLFLATCFAAIAAWAYYELHNAPDTSMSDSAEPLTLLDGYIYPPQLDLPYPTCSLKRGFDGVETVQLVDFAFLSKLAYNPYEDLIPTVLDEWFGPGVAYNNAALIAEFKSSPRYTDYGFGSAVSYKAITFPAINIAVLTIRGTQTAWDVIADAQLWLAAISFQGLRFVLPFSQIFTPILHRMVWIITQLESDTIKKVAFYRETNSFVEFLKGKGYNVVVTGHSLGGGLAIITGAEADTSAVAISGPNAMLSRETFFPPVTVEQLNKLTFNVIPARDPVPMIDDKARLYQNINCTAPTNEVFSCHSITRSTCELHYTCGTRDRPAACECALEFGYPEPTYTGTTTESQQSFIEKCLDKCEVAGGSLEKCTRWKQSYEEGGGQM